MLKENVLLLSIGNEQNFKLTRHTIELAHMLEDHLGTLAVLTTTQAQTTYK